MCGVQETVRKITSRHAVAIACCNRIRRVGGNTGDSNPSGGSASFSGDAEEVTRAKVAEGKGRRKDKRKWGGRRTPGTYRSPGIVGVVSLRKPLEHGKECLMVDGGRWAAALANCHRTKNAVNHRQRRGRSRCVITNDEASVSVSSVLEGRKSAERFKGSRGAGPASGAEMINHERGGDRGKEVNVKGRGDGVGDRGEKDRRERSVFQKGDGAEARGRGGWPED